ncbi:hypothetical protein [Mycolicibacter arupensis]|jgi:hypothetical protein|uniref:Uncharacterized protein n=1 Tax=Mycolicibacter arupensis TaxID=342002 RepID=A0A5C7XLH6_9MYCO|nr:hypothetical protein [Mycolicibacter arupensis]TXI50198.1 MAG: hypothetical protein E6Q54_21760 [Mycolicibacter arupensis]
MNRRQRRAAGHGDSSARQYLASLDGARIPGGCDDCDAYQTVDATQAPLFLLQVHHDSTCPWFTNYRKENP